MEKIIEKGKLLFESGRYFLESSGERQELKLGLLARELDFQDLVGEEVEILYEVPRPIVAGIYSSNKKMAALCYEGCDKLMKSLKPVDAKSRMDLLQRMLDLNTISKEVYDRLR